ncbi:MAG: REC domain-containing diguanylate cyclase [Epsilonproteobacteria bacterium]|nr:MAG: REC domain-containing diguanylate cyclase [Campylobacterota bacterium]
MSKKTILIVDDNQVILDMLEEKLNKEIKNINILKALTYKEAVKHILNKNQKVDISILDLNLPDAKDGAIVSFSIKKNIPTIVLTGTIDENLKQTLIKYNILNYIVKNNSKGIDRAVNSASQALKNYDTNILVVDDSSVQLSLAVSMLEKMNLNITTAMDGMEAYEILENSDRKFSLVITDFIMPKMDGIDLTLKIREKYGKDELGIIVLSANDTPDISSQFIRIGANDFINKPYSEIEVITRVNSNLKLLELFQETKDMANKDFMTGAYNRRFFFDCGQSIFGKAKRDKKDLCIAMLDIDKFKIINDTYGHDVGDVAICEVANILNDNLNKTNLMARFGGEEFCILLENISLEEIEQLFEKIRAIFENNIIKINGLEINFTVSIGIYYGIEEDLEEMIKKSDDGLYYCKNNGRNQIAINKGMNDE